MNSGSIHDLRSSQPQPKVLGSGRMGASSALAAINESKKVSASMVEESPDSPFKRASDKDLENADMDEGISESNRS